MHRKNTWPPSSSISITVTVTTTSFLPFHSILDSTRVESIHRLPFTRRIATYCRTLWWRWWWHSPLSLSEASAKHKRPPRINKESIISNWPIHPTRNPYQTGSPDPWCRRRPRLSKYDKDQWLVNRYRITDGCGRSYKRFCRNLAIHEHEGFHHPLTFDAWNLNRDGAGVIRPVSLSHHDLSALLGIAVVSTVGAPFNGGGWGPDSLNRSMKILDNKHMLYLYETFKFSIKITYPVIYKRCTFAWFVMFMHLETPS